MRLLLDTHAFLWWLALSERLSIPALRAITDEENDILVSAASAWEISTKHSIGKLPEAETIVLDMVGNIADQGFEELPITVQDAAHAGKLPGPHRDPFDRMLIAQAKTHDLVLISVEALFDQYGIRRLW